MILLKTFLKRFIIYFIGTFLVTFLMDCLYHGNIYKALPDSAFHIVKATATALLVTLLSLAFGKRKANR